MPQISKFRIVNFQYNDGKRLIADELFDFESEDKGPSDVLINLANGGGKSVMVQLMMQPIIPRARVAGRRIESFFRKAGDHCFAAIEWALDGSRMKLMTGIAMAASDSSRDSDADRGFHIKYYTFISSYQDYQGSCNIVSLPLSRRENGRFVPASFDDIRNLAKRSGGMLERYASDDNIKWQERLAQYGISQNEWHTIEKLNSNEDGLSKYFSSLKTSDAVIDKLIIGSIEERQSFSISKEDSSLETMLISYAKQFSKQKDIIKEREICSGFYDMLGPASDEAKKLWADNDSLENSIGTLFAYEDALAAERASQKKRTEELEAEKTKLEDGIHHVMHEKASADYYAVKEIFDQRSAEMSGAETARSDADRKKKEADKKLRIIECARYYAQLKDIENRIAAVSAEIEDRENNSESAGRLASLKYSALLAVRAEMEKTTAGIQSLTEEKDRLGSELDRIGHELSKLEREIGSAKADADKADAVFEKQKNDDDEIAEEAGLKAFRMLDGRYRASDLDERRMELSENEQSAAAVVEENDRRISDMEALRDAMPQKIADAGLSLRDMQTGLGRLEADLSEYEAAAEEAGAVFKRHGISDDEPSPAERAISYITERTAEAGASVSAVIRKTEAAEEALSAAKRGTLHIHKILSDFLDASGVSYTSVEKYILTQQSAGLMSEERCSELLRQYPFAAYGIICDAADIGSLYEEAEDKWLPAMLPVFTMEDIGRMMNGELPAQEALAAYSGEYFSDSRSYEEHLESSLGSCCRQRAMLEERIESLRKDLETACAFAAYDAGWEKEKRSEKERLEKSIAEQQKHIGDMESEYSGLKESIVSLRGEGELLRSELSTARNMSALFEKLLRKLDEEDELYMRCEAALAKLGELKDLQKRRLLTKAESDAAFKELSEKLNDLTRTDQALKNSLAIVDGAEAPENPDEDVDGEWSDLTAQYQALLEAQNADLKHLNNQKIQLIKDKEDRLGEIKRRNCDPHEYEGLLFTDELEYRASADLRAAEDEYQSAQADYDAKSRAYTRAEANLENAERNLSEYGGALPPGEVGADFDDRISDLKNRITDTGAEIRKTDKILSRLQRDEVRAEMTSAKFERPSEYEGIPLEEDHSAQLDGIISRINKYSSLIDAARRRINESLRRMASGFGAASPDIGKTVNSMQQLLADPSVRGDRYYTLCEHIEANMHTVMLRISQIDTDLGEFSRTKGDLVRQCVIHGRQMYEGLMQLSADSKVTVHDRRQKMIRFDIPETVDESAASARITAEIEKGAEEIAAKLTEDSYAESGIRRLAENIVGSKRLLRKYIGADNIVLKAYKIDRNPENSGYRTWEQTQVNNSGAEKFVVYFAVILALMAYAREDYGDTDRKNSRSVLVLDNPFGPISSKHMLEPMFRIARNYKVQMICLSDISKSDILSCFDLVIRAVIRQFAFGSKEQLTHEGNERIEHGFYRSEQLKLYE